MERRCVKDSEQDPLDDSKTSTPHNDFEAEEDPDPNSGPMFEGPPEAWARFLNATLARLDEPALESPLEDGTAEEAKRNPNPSEGSSPSK